MVGQAAEGLGTDDVGHPGVDELQHFSGEEPALAHLVAVPQIALDVVVQLVEVAGCSEAAGTVEGVDHGPLVLLNVAGEDLAELLLDPPAAVDVHVHVPVIDLEDDEVGEAGHHRLGSL